MGSPARQTRRKQVEIKRRLAGQGEGRPTGRLILLIGPEGRGKDMLVAAARRRFAADASFAFPQRVITRAAGPNDEHVAVSRRAFRDMEERQSFLLTWRFGETSFGVPIAAKAELDAGRTVVVAAMEGAISASREACHDVRLIEVLAGPDRTRSGLAGVAMDRLPRDPDAWLLEHTGDIAAAVRRFHDLLLDDRARRLGGQG